MKELWLKYAGKIDALTLRERSLVFAAAAAAAFAIVFFIAVDPAQRRQNTLTKQMQAQKEEIATLQKGSPLQPQNPDATNRARVDALKGEITAADDALKQMQRDLVPADRVNALLQEMLARDSQLALVSLRTLPVEPLVQADKVARDAKAPDTEKAATENSHVYKHGVEITVQGGYSSLHEYLARLERSPSRMYWWRARLDADDTSRLTLTVTVYTLSLDRAWLQV